MGGNDTHTDGGGILRGKRGVDGKSEMGPKTVLRQGLHPNVLRLVQKLSSIPHPTIEFDLKVVELNPIRNPMGY